MGSIYKRGEIYWVKYYRAGKPHRESSRSTKRADAKRLLKKREGEISRGKLPGIYFDRTTFEDLVELIRADYNVNGYKTFNRIELAVEHLGESFSGMRAQTITTPLISRYIDKRLEEDASNGSINRELSALRRMFRLGVQHNKVDRPPHIDLLKENNVRKGFFEHGDFLALREALPEYLAGFITFAYRVGWRISEITNFTWAQVDRENGIVRLEPGETKNEEGRTVYLDDELKEVFKQQRKRR
jgi:integrase